MTEHQQTQAAQETTTAPSEADIQAWLDTIDVADPKQVEDSRPTKNGMQRQGDLLVIPSMVLRVKPETGPITPLTGQVTALKGGSNEHVLTATGTVTWAAVPAGGADLGVLTVAPGSVATLAHTGHHGSLRIGPGEYVLRRQKAHTAPAAVVAPASPPFEAPTVGQTWQPREAPRPRPRRWVAD